MKSQNFPPAAGFHLDASACLTSAPSLLINGMGVAYCRLPHDIRVHLNDEYKDVPYVESDISALNFPLLHP